MTKQGNKLNYIFGVVIVASLVFGVLNYAYLFHNARVLGGSGYTHYQTESFLQGLYSGTNRQLSISNAGLLTTSGGITNSGTLTQSGATTLSGALTVTGETQTARAITGGSVLAIGNATSSVLTAANICDYSGATITMTATSGAVTLPALSSLNGDCMASAGKTMEWFFRNDGTATTSALITAGASTTLIADANLDAHDSDLISGGQTAILKLWRKSTTELIVFVSKFKDSD